MFRKYKNIKNKQVLLASFLLFVSVGSLFAQSKKIDSLKIDLSYANDTDKISILLELSALIQEISFQQSINYAQEAKKVAISMEDRERTADVINKLGNIYTSNGKYEEATLHFHKAIGYYKKINNYKEIKNIYFELSKCSEKSKKFHQAYQYHQQFTHLKDSLYQEENKKRIEDFKVQYETRLKENELKTLNKKMKIELLKAEKQKVFRNYLIGFIIIMLIGVLAGFINLRTEKKNQRKIINYNKRLELTNSKISRSELEHRQINDTKNKFLTVISHDLITPFNSLLGFTELLMEEAETKDRELIKNYSGIIYKSSRELFNLLENMLQWSRALRNRLYYQPESFNLAKTIDNVLNIYMVKADKKSIRIETNIEESLYPYADITLVSTILKKLFDNSLKNAPVNSTIVVTAKRKNKNITVSISDEAEEIYSDFQSDVSDPDNLDNDDDSITKTAEGLALTVVKKFVEKNNGDFSIERQQNGKSNIFTFTLPAEKT